MPGAVLDGALGVCADVVSEAPSGVSEGVGAVEGTYVEGIAGV